LGPALALAGFSVGSLSLIVSGVAAANEHQWALAATWGAALLVPCVLAYVVLTSPKRERPPPTEYFRPFAELDTGEIWRRDRDLQAVKNGLLAAAETDGSAHEDGRAQRHACLVVGMSGAGKSVLLKDALPRALGRTLEKDYFYIRNYKPSLRKLEAALAVSDGIVVLDQFEQYLAALRSRPAAERRLKRKEFAALLADRMESGNVQVIIAIRTEWYFDLYDLAELLPPFQESVVINPPDASPDDPAYKDIRERLQQALGHEEPDVAEDLLSEIAHDGRLLPLEVQIVGATLERVRAREPGSKVDRDYLVDVLQGVPGAINTFFHDLVDGADDPRVALKVLCALSARTRFRRQEDQDDLFEALYEQRDKVTSAIKYLVEQGLIVEVPNSRYELAHDYLAEVFHQQSASVLDPTDRDNVEFHIEERQRKRQRGVVAPDETFVHSLRTRENTSRFRSLAVVVLLVLGVLMTARLLYSGLGWYVVGNGPRAHPLIGAVWFDETYVPIFLAQFTFAVYLALFYHRILRHLHEGLIARAFSQLTIVIVLPCALAAALIPHAWVLSVACCGSGIGFKMVSLGRASHVNEAARERMMNMGRITLSNMVGVVLIGAVVLGMSIVLVHGAAGTKYWTIGMIMWSIMFTTAAIVLIPAHVGARATALTLGLLDRPAVPIIPLPDE
jgi:hypothetical protein